MSVLIVEDHKELAATIGEYLEHSGFDVDYAMDGITGLHLAVTNIYDAIVLDVMMPGIDGFEVCNKIRNEAKSDIPILMLTARDQIQDKLEGFNMGADDYLVKPFNPDELVARLKALIKRYKGELNKNTLMVGDLSYDPATSKVHRQGKQLKVSPTGLQILKILMTKSPEVISKEILSKELWGDLSPESDVLRSHLYLLRKTIDKPFDKQLLHTVPAVGIKLEEI
ncbi:MAG: response regulator transcription factor [Flavobacteriaceae bacterium]|nr:response regulator transcription factor [Flavobacteriaceae bacterium]